MPKRRRKRGRPRTGHDPMIGVRLPVKIIKKIERVAEALSCDRSSAIRWMINDALEHGRTSTLLWSGKGSRFADQIARSVVLGFKAKAANAAVSRAVPAGRVEAETRALRSAEAAEESLTRLGDRIALGGAAKPQRRRRSTVLEPAPVAPSFDTVPKLAIIPRSPPATQRKNRQLNPTEVQAAVERAIASSQAKRRGDGD
jgi:hypothetical protein